MVGASSIDIEQFERRLIAERSELAAELPRVGQLVEMFPRTEVVDPEDLSVHLSDRDVTLDIIDRKTTRLALVDAALGRLADGTFGECGMCGDQIAPKRLAADPAVALCIECQQRLEDRSSRRFPEL
jgi:DnaK suppressor protein